MKIVNSEDKIQKFSKELNCEVSEIIDMASPSNFIKPQISFDFNKIDISLSPSYSKLYEEIAFNYKIIPSQIKLFNSDSSAVFTLFRHLALEQCVIYSPSKQEYKTSALKFDYKVRTISRFENINLSIKDDSFVVLINPSIPDGTYYNLDTLMEYWKKKSCTVLIDETFLDFCEGESAIKYLEEYDNLYILKSIINFYSCDGLAISTIISSKKNIEKLKTLEVSSKLSSFDIHYLSAIFEDKNFKRISKAINTKNTIELEKILENSNHIDFIYQSSTNFILAKLKNYTALEFQDKLKAYKIMINNCLNFDYLDETYIQIVVKSSASNTNLKKALGKIC